MAWHTCEDDINEEVPIGFELLELLSYHRLTFIMNVATKSASKCLHELGQSLKDMCRRRMRVSSSCGLLGSFQHTTHGVASSGPAGASIHGNGVLQASNLPLHQWM